MAKIKYASFVAGLSGKSGSTVFFRSNNTGFGYMRAYTYPTITAENNLRGEEFKNLTTQLKMISTAGLADLKAYAAKYRNLPPVSGGDLSARANNHVAVWIMAVYNLSRANPANVEPSSITFADLTTLYDFTNVANMVANGYLPAVPGWQDLDKNL